MLNTSHPTRVAVPSRSPSLPIWWIAWRRKGLLTLGLLLGASLGIAGSLFMAPVYQSTAHVLVGKKRPDALTGVDTRPLSSEEFVAPAQELLKSHVVLERAINQRDLASLEIFASADEEPVEVLRKRLNVTTTKSPILGSATVLKLSFRGSSQGETQLVLDAVLDSFRTYLRQKYQAIGTDTFELILREKDVVRQELSEKEKAYRDFRENGPLLTRGKDALQEKLNTIQAKRGTAVIRRVEAEAQVAAIEAAIRDGQSMEVIQVALAGYASRTDPADPAREKPLTFSEQLYPLLLEKQKLRSSYGPEHPEVKAIEERIKLTRRKILFPPKAGSQSGEADNQSDTELARAAVERDLQVLKVKCQEIKSSEELLSRLLKKEQEEAHRLQAFEIQDDSFKTAITLNKALYETLVKRLSEISLIRNVGGYDIEEMEPPTPGKKIAPVLAIFVIFGGMMGTMLAFGLGYLLEVGPSVAMPPQTNGKHSGPRQLLDGPLTSEHDEETNGYHVPAVAARMNGAES
jgi:uncharacterized protein involved in exopolysaccharide biosynthesis